MFPEFGQSPKCLEVDLDSYEDSWAHVAAFRGQSGWLQVAHATIQSEHDWFGTTLVAACDEQEIPIPAWRAMHLTQCRWERLDYCHEQPPDLLDELLCEEEGAFFARWQRDMNSELATLYDSAQRKIEAIEAKAAVNARQVDWQIADLRRRRRMANASSEERATITAIIAELEAKRDQVMLRLAEQRAALRRRSDAAEEALWQRSDVLIEVEPICLVRWHAKDHRTVSYYLSPEVLQSGMRAPIGSALGKLEKAAAQKRREKRERLAAAKEHRRSLRAQKI